MLLDIQNLGIEVLQNGSKQTLCKNLTFPINSGETIGILGESGSGKSITALSILQLLPPSITISQGSINYLRKDNTIIDLVSASKKELQNIRGKEISMVFQEPMTSLNPSFTCGSQVSETILQHQRISTKEAREKTIELFDKVKLPNPNQVFSSYPHQLSGGQKQRIAIARALLLKPKILILDDSTSSVDVETENKIQEALEKTEHQHTSFVVAQRISTVLTADKIIVIDKGRISAQGTHQELIRTSPIYQEIYDSQLGDGFHEE